MLGWLPSKKLPRNFNREHCPSNLSKLTGWGLLRSGCHLSGTAQRWQPWQGGFLLS